MLGVTCMWIASKYMEIHPPGVFDFIHQTDNIYSREQVIQQELDIVMLLDFDLTLPTIFSFFERFI